MIKCGYCKNKHETVQQVKDCSKVQIGTIVDDANEVTAHAVKVLTIAKEIDAAKVEIGTIVEDAPAPVIVPEHRVKPNIASVATIAANIANGTKAAFADVNLTKSYGDASYPQTEVAPVIIKKGQDLDLGMYQVDGTVYKVKFNKAGTHKYVEKLYISNKHVYDAENACWKTVPKGKFGYANGMIYSLTSESKMDEAAAKKFHDDTKEKYGQQYGFCCVCGKLLTVKKSIEAGIGPTCAGKI